MQPQYYELDPIAVEKQLWGELRNVDDQPALYAIFLSPEWRSQRAPVPENLIRQLRHHLELESGGIYACAFCAVTDKEANHMTEHLETHFGLKRYSCPEW